MTPGTNFISLGIHYCQNQATRIKTSMQKTNTSATIFITTPLESKHVDRIRSVSRKGVTVLYDPDLLPPTRYTCDHNGMGGFILSPEQEHRWKKYLESADILWNFPPDARDGTRGLDFAPNVKWIQTTSSGIGKRIEELNLTDSDILITNSRGVHAKPLAEFVFLVLLSHVKRLLKMQTEQKERHWERFCSKELAGQTLGLIGMGELGCTIASIGRVFDMRIIALASPGSRKTAEELGIDQLFPNYQIHDMLGETDALVLAAPHTPETERMIDDKALSALKKNSVFVNIARGHLVDESALIKHLKEGRIAFAGLDTLTVEPLPKDSLLWDLPNVLISPHSASTVEAENERITEIFCHNLLCYLEGRRGDMRNIVNNRLMY